MLSTWLSISQRGASAYHGFLVIDARESSPITAQVHEHLKNLLIEARHDSAFLEDAARILGWENVQERVAAAQPQVATGRRGEFGEVISAAILSEFHGYIIPIRKLSYAITGGQSLPGTDVIALKCDGTGDIQEVCFVECKLRTTSDTGAAVQAYEQLHSDYRHRVADLLFFVASHLHGGGPLYSKFMDYMRDRALATEKDSFAVSLTWDGSAWTERVLSNLDDNGVELEPLTVHVVHLRNVGQLVAGLFSAIGVRTIIDDD